MSIQWALFCGDRVYMREKMSRIFATMAAMIMTLMTTMNSAERRSKLRLMPCPIAQATSNDTDPEAARCVCAPPADIRCHGGVVAIPKLVVEHLRHEQSTSFAGFYAARQEIGGVPAFAFADLPVERIVLNFNPIGHRQACHLPFRTLFRHRMVAHPVFSSSISGGSRIFREGANLETRRELMVSGLTAEFYASMNFDVGNV